ncbi:Hsp90 chaperone hsp82 [Entomophthora muscae]|uniref:Hsp90 chaperone hsp82 n=1 Tax=Entomophthora muscae TaxID=34485 RepID=A0ACC2S2D0_9FUNG|nr:Hsp90 chaperone hsp82 [Entomophthora muscae]
MFGGNRNSAKDNCVTDWPFSHRMVTTPSPHCLRRSYADGKSVPPLTLIDVMSGIISNTKDKQNTTDNNNFYDLDPNSTFNDSDKGKSDTAKPEASPATSLSGNVVVNTLSAPVYAPSGNAPADAPANASSNVPSDDIPTAGPSNSAASGSGRAAQDNNLTNAQLLNAGYNKENPSAPKDNSLDPGSIVASKDSNNNSTTKAHKEDEIGYKGVNKHAKEYGNDKAQESGKGDGASELLRIDTIYKDSPGNSAGKADLGSEARKDAPAGSDASSREPENTEDVAGEPVSGSGIRKDKGEEPNSSAIKYGFSSGYKESSGASGAGSGEGDSGSKGAEKSGNTSGDADSIPGFTKGKGDDAPLPGFNDDKQYIWEFASYVFFITTCNTVNKLLGCGTMMCLYLKKNQLGYLEEKHNKDIIKKNSELIGYPIHLVVEKKIERKIKDDDNFKKVAEGSGSGFQATTGEGGNSFYGTSKVNNIRAAGSTKKDRNYGAFTTITTVEVRTDNTTGSDRSDGQSVGSTDASTSEQPASAEGTSELQPEPVSREGSSENDNNAAGYKYLAPAPAEPPALQFLSFLTTQIGETVFSAVAIKEDFIELASVLRFNGLLNAFPDPAICSRPLPPIFPNCSIAKLSTAQL